VCVGMGGCVLVEVGRCRTDGAEQLISSAWVEMSVGRVGGVGGGAREVGVGGC
jgi:hypothetical protein